MITRLFLVLSLLLSQTAVAQDWKLKGWQEAVIGVADLDSWLDLMQGTLGWSVLEAGTLGSGHATFLDLEKSGQGFALLGVKGTDRGYLRLIELGEDAEPIRSNDQLWDTGGWLDLNVRVADVKATSMAIMQRGWSSTSDPMQFTFGKFTVKEWLPRGPGGVRFAFIQRVAPALTGWPHMRQTSRAFNSTIVVADMEKANSFWTHVMGFKPYLLHRAASKEEGPNVLGLPHNLADEIIRDVRILHPDGVNEGSIELLAYEGAVGRSFAKRASHNRLGIQALRFETLNLDAFLQHASESGVALERAPALVNVPGLGKVRMAYIKAPEGGIIHIFELQE